MAAASTTEKVKLLGRGVSPFVTRVVIALNLKRVEYEYIHEEFFCQRSELLIKSNPVYKKVPVLIHEGNHICESMIIVEYIDEVWTCEPCVLPSDPFDRAVARFWAAYIDDKLPPLLKTLRAAAEEADKAEVADQAVEVLRLLEAAFAKCSKGKGFFGGDTIGYLDIALGCYLGWVKAVEKMNAIELLDEKKVPLLMGWAERFFQDNAVKEVMPEIDVYIEFAKMLSTTSAH